MRTVTKPLLVGEKLKGGATALITGTRALVSGATGFLGGHLAQVLHGLGYRVRILVHKRQRVEHLLALGMEIVEGDLLDPASLVRATAGQSVVFHTAGKVTDWGPRSEYFQVNAEGTRNVIAACRDSGVGRLVHVSSLSVLGLPRSGEVITEETPYPRSLPDWYSQSKRAAEQLVRAANGVAGLATTVVRPGVIWGPGDITIVPRLAELLRAGPDDHDRRRSKPPRPLPHRKPGARARPGRGVARGPGAGLPHDRRRGDHRPRGRRRAGRRDGSASARLSLPYGVVYGIAALIEAAAHLARRTTPPSMTRYGVRLVACHCRYDIGRARRELGYRPTVTFREGIKQLSF